MNQAQSQITNPAVASGNLCIQSRAFTICLSAPDPKRTVYLRKYKTRIMNSHFLIFFIQQPHRESPAPSPSGNLLSSTPSQAKLEEEQQSQLDSTIHTSEYPEGMCKQKYIRYKCGPKCDVYKPKSPCQYLQHCDGTLYLSRIMDEG